MIPIIENAKDDVIKAINALKASVTQEFGSVSSGIEAFRSAFDAWRAPWTADRAAKIDNLDVDVSSRADGGSYTPARATKLDYLDVDVSSRADGASYTPARAENLDYLDNLDVQVSSRAPAATALNTSVWTNKLADILYWNNVPTVERTLSLFEKNVPYNSTLAVYTTSPIIDVSGAGMLTSFFAKTQSAHLEVRIIADGIDIVNVWLEYMYTSGGSYYTSLVYNSSAFSGGPSFISMTAGGKPVIKAASGYNVSGYSGGSVREYIIQHGSFPIYFRNSLQIYAESHTGSGVTTNAVTVNYKVVTQ